jgi:hypothetical protein
VRLYTCERVDVHARVYVRMHGSPDGKARPWLDGGVRSRVGVGGEPELGGAYRNK